MLCRYIRSTNVEGLVSSPAAKRISERSIVSIYGQRSNQISPTASRPTSSRPTSSRPTRSLPTRTENDLSPVNLQANDNSDANSTQPTQSTVQDDSDRNEIQPIVNAAVVKIRKGLKNLESARTLPPLSKNFKHLYDKAKYFEDDLWTQAEVTLKGVKWSSRFLSSCFRIIRLNLRIEDGANDKHITDSTDKDDYRKRNSWQTGAEIINSIVNCLLKTWDWKAFLIYPALQSTGYYFTSASYMAREKRQKLVSSLVNILGDEVPAVSSPPVLLDPAFFLDAAPKVKISAEKLRWESHSSFDYSASGYKLLSEGEHDELPNERTHSAFSFRKRKTGAESESTFSTPHQNKRLSTGAFLSCSNHGYEQTLVSNPEDYQFRQDVEPDPHSSIPSHEPTIHTNPTGHNNNSISINALLNAPDYIVGFPQSQQLPIAGISSTQIASGAVLSGHEQDSTADEQAEIGSSNTRSLEAQAKAYSPPSTRRRLGSFSESDLSLPQVSSGITGDGEMAAGSTILGNTNISVVSQAEDALQIEVTQTVEGGTLDSSITTTEEQRGKYKRKLSSPIVIHKKRN
ncbi:hypothetical protein CJF32_00011241 [Rutstroemia sp. NJR-2017a WRK4]|nr:hypothetical protein CJF32_00011241 [Rutstroemia sp. NJR-2017a WRK4]